MQRTTKDWDSSPPVSIPQQERHWICAICIRSIWYEDGCDRAGSSKRASLNSFPAAVDSGNQTDVDPQSPQPAANKPRNTSHWQHSFGKTSGGRHPRKIYKADSIVHRKIKPITRAKPPSTTLPCYLQSEAKTEQVTEQHCKTSERNRDTRKTSTDLDRFVVKKMYKSLQVCKTTAWTRRHTEGGFQEKKPRKKREEREAQQRMLHNQRKRVS